MWNNNEYILKLKLDVIQYGYTIIMQVRSLMIKTVTMFLRSVCFCAIRKVNVLIHRIGGGGVDLYSQLSRCSTARGADPRYHWDGPAKVGARKTSKESQRLVRNSQRY